MAKSDKPKRQIEKGKRGGWRPKSGRKPSLVKALQRLALEKANGEAEKSLQFLVDVRDNRWAKLGLRVAAAIEIKNTVWGKPKQMVTLANTSEEDAFKIEYVPFQNKTDKGH